MASGADQNIANNRGETALALAESIQPDQQQNFINALTGKYISEDPNSALMNLASHTNQIRNRPISSSIPKAIHVVPDTSAVRTYTIGKSKEN
jgi:hypothetical protein